jgi:hypothetical protein
MAQIALPETLTADKRRKVNLRELSRSCGILFRDPVFVGLTFIAGFRHGKLLLVHLQRVLRLHRSIRADPDRVLAGLRL